MKWCNGCQDHYPEKHYDEADHHLVGGQYGRIGRWLAIEEAAREFLEQDRLAVHDPTGWWGMEAHIAAYDALHSALMLEER